MSQSLLVIHPDPEIRLELVRSCFSNVQVLLDQEFIGVKDMRALRERIILEPQLGEQVYYISLERWASDSQNSLLKLLEEPLDHTNLIIGAPARRNLLPTVLSRLTELNAPQYETITKKYQEKYSSFVTRQDLINNIECIDEIPLDHIISIIRSDIAKKPTDLQRVARLEKMLLIASHKKLTEKQIKEGLALGV